MIGEIFEEGEKYENKRMKQRIKKKEQRTVRRNFNGKWEWKKKKKRKMGRLNFAYYWWGGRGGGQERKRDEKIIKRKERKNNDRGGYWSETRGF